MEYLRVLIAVCAVIATLRKDIYGMCCFMAVRILIPESVRFVINSLSLNTAVILCVFIVVVLKQIYYRKISYRLKSYPVVLLLLVLYFAVALPLSNTGDLTSQYSRLIQFVITEILPPILLFSCLKKDENVVIFVKAYLMISLVCCIYGVLVLFMHGLNPYVSFWTGDSTYMETWKGVSTSATFVSNNTFGYYLTMSFPFCVYIYNVFYKKSWVSLLLVLQLTCILFTKKRSAMICLIVFALLYFAKNLSKRKFRTLIIGLGLAGIGLVSIFVVPQLNSVRDFIVSSLFFWNDNAVAGLSTAELGSSWALRLRQVTYPYTEIEDNLLFGHGFGWCSWYLDNFKLHWPLYGFETIFASGICEFGILGYCVYFVIFNSGYKYAKYLKQSKFIKDNYPLLFVLTVIVMAIATGFNYYYLYFSLIVVMNSLRRQLRNDGSRDLERTNIWNQKFLLF